MTIWILTITSLRQSRSTPMKRAQHLLFLTWAAAACGGDSGTGPVDETPVATVELSGVPTGTLAVGTTATLTATVRDASGNPLSGRSTTWSSSVPAVAGVAGGTVTAMDRGTTTITATAEGRSATATITVVSVASNIVMEYSSSTLLTGDTMHIVARAVDAQGRTVPEAGAPALSVSGAALTMNGSVFTGASVGTATVTASSGGLTRTAQIRVFPGGGDRVAALSRIDSLMIREIERLGIPAASIAVANAGRLVYARAYGYADTATKRIAATNQMYRIGSTSKPLTAVATLKLVQDGLLQLDQKPFVMLSDIPPRGGTEDPRLQQVTIRDLLQHSGGWNANRDVDDSVWAAVWRDQIVDQKVLAQYGRGVPLATAPGTSYAYSNFAYQVLGRVIEKVSGQSYEQYVRNSILTPAGVTAMKLGRTPLAQRDPLEVSCYDNLPLTTGMFGSGKWCDVVGEQEYAEASGSWIASAIDLVRWVSVVDGIPGPRADVLTAPTLATMVARPSFAPTGSYYALGWQIVPGTSGTVWTHAGAQTGGDGFVMKLGNGMVVAILGNLTRGYALSGASPDAAVIPLIQSLPAAAWPTGTVF